jgi:hypothetical protein
MALAEIVFIVELYVAQRHLRRPLTSYGIETSGRSLPSPTRYCQRHAVL